MNYNKTPQKEKVISESRTKLFQEFWQKKLKQLCLPITWGHFLVIINKKEGRHLVMN